MNLRVPPGIAVTAVALVVVIVGVGVVVSVVDLSPAGLEVNGEKVSQQTIDRELRGFAGSAYFEALYAQQGGRFRTSGGALSAVAGAQWLALRIQNTLTEAALDAGGESVTAADLDRARRVLRDEGVLRGVSDDAAARLTRLQASATKLNETSDSAGDARDAVARLARRARVRIADRYGSWNRARLGVCPPSGCETVVPVVGPPQQ
jgi:hypothetical protein